MYSVVSNSTNSSQPDRLEFERRIRRLEREILRMGALVEQSFRLSHQALFAQNVSIAAELPLLDKKIDQFYRQIELECAALMALTPLAEDLRCLSAFMQLVRDLERIGDYAVDLSKMALKLFAYPPHACMSEIEDMSHHAQAMLAASLVALADLDETAGRNIKRLDDAVDTAYDTVYQTLAQQRDVPGVVEPIILLALAIRCLERMADHATNVGQRVAYIVTGKRG